MATNGGVLATYSQWLRIVGWLREQGYAALTVYVQEKLSEWERKNYPDPLYPAPLRAQVTLRFASEPDARQCLTALDEVRVRR